VVRLWTELAEEMLERGAAADGRAIAAVLNAQLGPAVDRRVMDALRVIALEMANADEASANAVRDEISVMVSELAGPVLRRMAGLQGDSLGRRDYLVAFDAAFPPEAVLAFLIAGADGRTQSLSQPLLRLLTKLVVQAGAESADLRTRALSAFRALVKDIIARWWVVARDSFGFEHMFGAAEPVEQRGAAPEPERIIQMAIEVDTVGGALWSAVSLMVNRGNLTELMELLKQAPKENEVPRQISRHVATPTLLRSVLRTEPVDFDIAERLAESMGLDGARLMLDELAESESRTIRHGIFDRLAKMGVEIGPLVIERLNDKRWYVERNLLALLAEIEYWPDNFSLDSYIAHDEMRVRREAIRYLLKIPGQRDQAILSALKQPDMMLVRAGLMAVSDYGSEAAIPVIAKRIAELDFPADLRIIGIRLLQRSRSTLALEALLRFVDGGKSFMNKPRLADTSAEMLAALGVLHSVWPRERRAAVFLEAARKSKSPEVRAAVEGS
jgi:hypothetical protein